MNISVIGTGYVGLVQGVVLSDFGLNVICMDTNKEKIDMLLNGDVPIYEPGLRELVEKVRESGRISFTTDIKKTVENSDVIFIAVGTPPKEDGSADLQYVLSVAKEIGKHINGYKVVVDKSTVPVGTGRMVAKAIQEELDNRGVDFEFDVVSNPEFLREGKAIGDCMRPDRIVIGSDSEKAKEVMKNVYRVLYLNKTPFVFTGLESAEMIKYASNAFLAVKISFINEMALLSEKIGANIQEISKAMGMDGRISPKFLHAGPGFGGSCFPKDTKAIVDVAKRNGEKLCVIEAAIEANEKQKKKMVEKILKKMGSVNGKVFGILGLSFKPETDDMRDAPSLDIVKGLVENGATIRAYCPEGMEEAKWRLEDCAKSIKYCSNGYEVAEGVDALVLVTEWNQFRGMDLQKIAKLMKGKHFFDLRNVYWKDSTAKELFDYSCVGC